MCTDRWPCEEINKPFHPSSGYTLRKRMRLCALIIHSNRAVRGRQEFEPTVQNVLQVTKQTTIHFSRLQSITMCCNSINRDPLPHKWNSQDNKTVSAHKRKKYPTYQKLSNSVLGKNNFILGIMKRFSAGLTQLAGGVIIIIWKRHEGWKHSGCLGKLLGAELSPGKSGKQQISTGP